MGIVHLFTHGIVQSSTHTQHNEGPDCPVLPVGRGPRLPSPKNAFTCDLCVDIITDIDEFLTSDTTEQQIVDFVKEICAALGALISGLEETCNFLVQSQLPEIIEGIVNDNLNPTQVCTDIMGACP